MPDDTLEIMGRIDSQIKLRGVRIEAEGVSSVLSDAAASEFSIFVAVTIIGTHPDIAGGAEGLISFIAVGGDLQPPVSERKSGKTPSIINASTDSDDPLSAAVMNRIHQASVDQLASYMRPSFIIPVSFIPLSSNGKTDNKALKGLFESTDARTLLAIQHSWDKKPSNGYSDGNQHNRPPTATESKVIDIVSKLTNSNSLHYGSDLFQAGLDSINFSILARNLRKDILSEKCGAQPLRVADIMSHRTIDRLSADIDSRLADIQNADSVPNSPSSLFDERWRAHAEEFFEPDTIDLVLPPFPVQEGVIFRSIEEPGHYVQHFLYRCGKEIDVKILKGAWEQTMAQEQILRFVRVHHCLKKENF